MNDSKILLALNKPKGYVVTRSDELGRKTVYDILTKPGNCIKVYDIWVRGHVTDKHVNMAKRGVESRQDILKVLDVEKIGVGGAKTKLRVKIDEGKNRHIRRLFGTLKDPKFGTSLKVLNLSRISIGSFDLDIESGKWRFLSVEEEKKILNN